MARDAATSMSRENNVAPSRPATVKRKRFVDVGQKTVKQMNELARYVNAKGPCAICRTPGAVITLTQIRRRRRKFLRYLKSHEGRKGATKGSADIWPPESTPLLTPSAKAQKSVSWVEHPPEAQSDARPDYLTSDTGAFLLLLSLVALVIGILVIFKATGNSLKEYLGLITPATSVSSALPVYSEELAQEATRPSIEEVPAAEETQRIALMKQERAARQIQHWYRHCQATPHARAESEGARRKRIDRWAQSLRAFFSRKKINHIRAGLQKRWGKKKQGDKARSEGAEDVAPLESKEELPAAGSAHTLFSAYSSQNTDARGLEQAGPSTSIVGSDGSRSGQFMSYQGIPDSDSQFSGSSASHRSRSQHPVGRSRSAQ